MYLSQRGLEVSGLPTSLDTTEEKLIRLRDLPRDHPEKIEWVRELLFANPEDTSPIIWDGSMFVGKTTLGQIAMELIQQRGHGTLAMRLAEDVRYTQDEKIVAHDGYEIPCATITDVHDMYQQVLAYRLREGEYPKGVLVEEGHLHTQGLAGFFAWLKQEDILGVLTTLSRDFKKDYFRLRVPGTEMKDNILSPETIEDVIVQGRHIILPGICGYDMHKQSHKANGGPTCGAVAYDIQRMIGERPAGRFSPVYLIGNSEECIGRPDATYHTSCDGHHEIGPDDVI